MQASSALLDGAQKAQKAAVTKCFHCGTACTTSRFQVADKSFCCHGCQTVFELLTENGLSNFYELGEAAGVRVRPVEKGPLFGYLDEPAVRERLVDFSNESVTRVTFRIPAVHCIACVWLLENLFRLKPGIGLCKVNFPRKEVTIHFQNAHVKLSEVAALLSSLGYEPDLKLADVDGASKNGPSRRLWIQLGIAGFAFGNIMLLSISSYLGLDDVHGPRLKPLFAVISFVLALPVFFYSAADYWKSAWFSFKQRRLTIEVPIAVGLAAIFGQSIYEVATKTGDGYFDSLAGLLFFLLCGRLFQQKTYERLSFERDYKSFFPLSITRKKGDIERKVALGQLAIGDNLVIRNGELIPADSKLVSGPALIDYSFVTGESEPVTKQPGSYLYAGGRQIGGAIEVETIKGVSQSYLTSLWNQEAFRKEKGETLDTLINRYSERFTRIVMAIALGAAAYWAFVKPSLALNSFIAVLIVACPCALALAAPFTLGTAIRVLGRQKVFVKSPTTVETLAKVDAIAFDKTGTLTAAGAEAVEYHGDELASEEQECVAALASQSTHPLAVRISSLFNKGTVTVRNFVETPGCGMEGVVDGHEIWMGSAGWLEVRGVKAGEGEGTSVHVAIDGAYRGYFLLAHALRKEAETAVRQLAGNYKVALLSGDNAKEKERFEGIFPDNGDLHFKQSPLRKLQFIESLQNSGKTVMMVGDGLNDAGALKQSNVGVAVVEKISAFSPSSDVIMSAEMVSKIPAILEFSKGAVRIVHLSFIISGLYNIAGIAIAAQGLLSPIVCAILMPLSSITVVGFACLATAWKGKRIFKNT